MPPEQPLLTIAIPTYNRSGYLAQLLESLAPQLKSEPRVELIISDNASTDDTKQVVESFELFGLGITYLQQSINQGSDRNFLRCYEKASGKYFWLVGDDDVIPAGSVGRLLNLLQDQDYDLVYFRPIGFRDHPMPHYCVDRWGRSPEVIERGETFAKLVGNMITMISANIVNRQRAEAIPHSPFIDLVGTGFIHLGWSYALLSNFVRGLYIFDVLVSVREGNRAGYQISNAFGPIFKNLTDRLLGGQPALTDALRIDILKNCLPFLIFEVRSRRFGNFDTEDFHRILKPVYGRDWRYWLFVFPAAKGPLAYTWIYIEMRKLFIRAAFACRLFGRTIKRHRHPLEGYVS